MERRRRFKDVLCEVVWRAIEALDPGRQLLLLRELARQYALSSWNPRTRADQVRTGVCALHDVTEIYGHSPSIAEYRQVRKALPELDLPPDGNIRRWLGGGWNDCLRRALLNAVTDGDFASRPIGVNDRYDDGEIFGALRECARDLGHRPSLTEYLGWAHRPDVCERPGRRPRSYKVFERMGGLRAALAAAGLLDESEARYAANRRVLPSRYRYHDEDITKALQTVARPLGRSPRPREYEDQRHRLTQEALSRGETPTLPTIDVIRKRHGDWNSALVKAGLEPVESSWEPHLGKRRPAYSEEEKLEWIRQAWIACGEHFTTVTYKRWRLGMVKDRDTPVPCPATLERTFGGWREACERALPGRPGAKGPDATH
jgi:Homing endonuclease associated repeat